VNNSNGKYSPDEICQTCQVPRWNHVPNGCGSHEFERETTVTVQVSRRTHLVRGSMRPLQDRPRYLVCQDGKIVIDVTSRAEVTRLVRRRYGKGVTIAFQEGDERKDVQ
jgi:hypothetical protein